MSTLLRDLEAWLAWQLEHYRPGMNFGGDSLPRIRRVASALGLVRPGPALVLVAGTNGKGSVVSCLESLALAHGLRPGCYLSPWLVRYNDTLRVAGQGVDDGVICDSFRRLEEARGDEALTAFEARAIAAALVIAESDVDLAVMEVGLGGRLDAVNVFDADVAVITSIGLDHCEVLGPDEASIGREKAGIMRPGRPVVSADAGSHRWLRGPAERTGAVFHGAGSEYSFGHGEQGWWLEADDLSLDGLPPPALPGEHQLANAAGAVRALSLVPGVAGLESDAVAKGITGTTLRGRLERLPGPGRRWVDVAHNPPAARALAHWLAAGADPSPLRVVCAMRAGKDHAATLAALAPRVSHWHLAGLPAPEGAPVTDLKSALETASPGAPADCHEDVETAWREAARLAGERERLLAFGSFDTARRVLLLESHRGSLDT